MKAFARSNKKKPFKCACPMARTLLLHRQGDVTRDDFSAARHCNIDATLFRIVTLFQHCNAVLR